MNKLIAYYRVSTSKQGRDGLGMDAQREAVRLYAAATGGKIDAEYTEVESGTLADRPQLAKAIAHARRNKARLVIAKLDRLARNVAFVSALMETGADFVCCDTPNANKFTIHIYASVAEEEARKISERTCAALQAAKRRGTLLGSARPGHWDGREQARDAGLAKGRERSKVVRQQQAMEAVADLLPMIQERRQAGDSLASIADQLNAAGQLTTRGSTWTAMQVKRVLDRAAVAA